MGKPDVSKSNVGWWAFIGNKTSADVVPVALTDLANPYTELFKKFDLARDARTARRMTSIAIGRPGQIEGIVIGGDGNSYDAGTKRLIIGVTGKGDGIFIAIQKEDGDVDRFDILADGKKPVVIKIGRVDDPLISNAQTGMESGLFLEADGTYRLAMNKAPSVSRSHLQIEMTGKGESLNVGVSDTNSMNGTWTLGLTQERSPRHSASK